MNTSTKKYAVSKVNGEIVDFSNPFVVFIKLPKIGYSCLVNENKLQLFHIPHGHEEAFVDQAYTPHQNVTLELKFQDNNLEYNDDKSTYHEDRSLKELFGETKQEFLDGLRKTILEQINGKTKHNGREAVILSFMSLTTFQQLLTLPSAVKSSYFDGTMVSNFNQFYPAYLLCTAMMLYQKFEKYTVFKDIPDTEIFTREMIVHAIHISEFRSNNYYKKSSQQIYNLMYSELIEYFNQTIKQPISRNKFMAQVKEKLLLIAKEALDGRYKWLSYIPYFESNNTPFGSDLLPYNVAVNKQQLMKEIYGNKKYKPFQFTYCDKITSPMNDLRRFDAKFVKKHIQGA